MTAIRFATRISATVYPNYVCPSHGNSCRSRHSSRVPHNRLSEAGTPPLGLGEVIHCDGDGHEGGFGCAFFACCAFFAGGVTCRAASTGKEREAKIAPNQWVFHVGPSWWDGTLCAAGAYSILMSYNLALAQLRLVITVMKCFRFLLKRVKSPSGPSRTAVPMAAPTRRPAFWPYSRSVMSFVTILQFATLERGAFCDGARRAAPVSASARSALWR
jgi:hypothetical protein